MVFLMDGSNAGVRSSDEAGFPRTFNYHLLEMHTHNLLLLCTQHLRDV